MELSAEALRAGYKKKGYEVIKFLAKGDAPQQNFITS